VCISTAVDGIVDDVYWNDSKEKVSVSSDCEEHEVTDCEEDTLQTKNMVRVTLMFFFILSVWN